jgi:uncharacterized membrane protein
MSEPLDPPPPPLGRPSDLPPPPPPPPPPPVPPEQLQGAGGFSVGNAFSYGFKKFQENLGPIVLATLGIVGVLIVLALLRIILVSAFDIGAKTVTVNDNGTITTSGGGFFGAALWLSLVLGLVQWIVGQVIAAGITRGSLQITDGVKPELSTMFKEIDYVQVAAASILTGIAVTIGIILCIIPGIIVAFLASFTTYFIVDQKMDAIEGIKASIAFTRAHTGDLVLFFLACIAAVIVGACLCGVGLLVAIPVVVIAQAFAFRSLQGRTVAP